LIAFRTGVVPATNFVLGVDNSDSDKLKIATSSLATDPVITVTQDGNVGIGTTSPNSLLYLFSSSSAAELHIEGVVGGNEDYTAVVRLIGEGMANGWRGGYMQYDSAGDNLIIGVHEAGDEATSSDLEAIVIDRATAHVGIGSNPDTDSMLHLQDSSDLQLFLQGDSASDYSSVLRLAGESGDNWRGGYIQYDATGNNLIIGVHDAGDKSTTSDIESIIIDRVTGNVGIATTTPFAQLDVKQAGAASGIGLLVSGTTSQTANLIQANNVSGTQLFAVNAAGGASTTALTITGLSGGGTQCLQIDNSGNVTGFGSGCGGSSSEYQTYAWVLNGTDLYATTAATQIGIGTTTPTGIFEVATSTGASLFHINESGNVGIGTATPGYPLEIRGASSSISLFDDSGRHFLLQAPLGGGSAVVGNVSNHTLVIKTNDTKRIVIEASGDVGIGDDSGPDAHLEVSANGTTGGNIFLLSSDSGDDGNLLTVKESGLVGIGTTSPTSLFDVYSDQTNTQLTITNASSSTAADPLLAFRTGAQPSTNFVLGVDNSDSDKFKIATSSIGTNDILTITQGGNVGIGTSSPIDLLQIYGTDTTGVHRGLSLSRPNNNTEMKLKFRTGGSYDWNFGLEDDFNDDSLYLYNGGLGEFTLVFEDLTNNLAIGTTSPASRLEVYNDQTNSQLTITNASSSTSVDPLLAFRTGAQPSTNFVLGVDNSDSDKFKIATSSLATDPVLTIMQGGDVGIGSSSPTQQLVVGENLVVGAASTSDDDYIYFGDGISEYLRWSGSDVEFGFSDDLVIFDSSPQLEFVDTSDDPDYEISVNNGYFAINLLDSSTRFRIISSGYVGIGTTSPTSLLDVYSDQTNTQLTITNASSSTSVDPLIAFRTGAVPATNFVLGVDNSDSDKFKIATSSLATNPILTIMQGGDVGIGLAAPLGDLHISDESADVKLILEADVNEDVDITFDGDRDWGIEIDGDGDLGTADFFHIRDVTANASRIVIDTSGNVGIGSTSPSSILSVQGTSTAASSIGGIYEYINVNSSTLDSYQFGNRFITNVAPTATASIIGTFIRMTDNTSLGNTVRGLEVQAYSGSNSLGVNTGVIAFGRTFGIQGITTGEAGGVYQPAGVYAETQHPTSGNALRVYSATSTSANLSQFYQETSAFTGKGMLMNFGKNSGSFTGEFMSLQVNDDLRFSVQASGSVVVDLPASGTSFALCHSGTASATNSVQIVDCAGSVSADYAEQFPVDEGVEFGDVVVTGVELIETTDGNRITKLVKSASPYQMNIIGVVSNNYSDFTSAGYNVGQEDNPMPVALNGRVPVKVTDENGLVQPGDKLTASSLAGYAMRATGPGMIIGTALEPFDGTVGKVMVFMNVGWWQPEGSSQESETSDQVFNIAGGTSTTSTTSQITDGNIDTTILTVEGDLDMQGKKIINVAAIEGQNWSLSESGDLMVNGKVVVAGTVETKSIFKNILGVAKEAVAAISDQISATYTYVAIESKLDVENETEEGIEFGLYGLLSSREELMISGSAQLVQGEATIGFDPSFSAAISSTTPLKILITPEAPFQGQLYIAEKSIYGFTVKESIYTESGPFTWQVIARRAGFEREGESNLQAPETGDQEPPVEETPPAGGEESPAEETPPSEEPSVEEESIIEEGSLVEQESSTGQEVPAEEPAAEEPSTEGSVPEESIVTEEPLVEEQPPVEESPIEEPTPEPTSTEETLIIEEPAIDSTESSITSEPIVEEEPPPEADQPLAEVEENNTEVTN
jgi:hypothetical protein